MTALPSLDEAERRMRLGWTLEEALFTPMGSARRDGRKPRKVGHARPRRDLGAVVATMKARNRPGRAA